MFEAQVFLLPCYTIDSSFERYIHQQQCHQNLRHDMVIG